jgi:hypothetical protein
MHTSLGPVHPRIHVCIKSRNSFASIRAIAREPPEIERVTAETRVVVVVPNVFLYTSSQV